MAKTSRDAWRHVREWSKFFSDFKEATEAEMDTFLEKHKRKKYLKQSLRRLEGRGFIVRKANALVSTKKGKQFFSQYAAKHPDLQKLKVNWDGKWRLVSFDVPIKENKRRDELRDLLRVFNFYQLHKSVWVCPSQLSGEFWKLVVDADLDKYCKAMVVDIIEGDKAIKAYFKSVIGQC
jgi:DNA-binding transcriptional regulator PaaX